MDEHFNDLYRFSSGKSLMFYLLCRDCMCILCSGFIFVCESSQTVEQWILSCLKRCTIMALHRNVLQEDNILCELYGDTRSDVSDYSDSESLDSDSDVPTTSSQRQLRSSTSPLTPQFLHPFFLTSIEIIFITVWVSSGIARQKRESLWHKEG